MDEVPLIACDACGRQITDQRQTTCPHCLATLSTRTFQRREDLDAFQEDRRAHGGPEDLGGRRFASRPILALVLVAAGILMLSAAVGIVVAASMSGSGAQLTNAFMQALVPFGLGAGLFQVARKYGGLGS